MPIARARCAIYSRNTDIRIYSVPGTIKTQKYFRQNLVMGQSCRGLAEHFLPAGSLLIFVRYGYILGKTLYSGPERRPGKQAHGGTGLAPRHHVRCP